MMEPAATLFHRLGDQNRDPQILELLLTICLHIIGDIRHGDILDAQADGQGHALALADGTARHRGLPVDVTGGVIVAVGLLPVDDDLAGCHLLGSVDLILGHAAVICQHHISLFPHQELESFRIIQHRAAQASAKATVMPNSTGRNTVRFFFFLPFAGALPRSGRDSFLGIGGSTTFSGISSGR